MAILNECFLGTGQRLIYQKRLKNGFTIYWRCTCKT